MLMSSLPLRMLDRDEGEIRSRIRSALLEVAREQREACAGAVLNLTTDAHFRIDRSQAKETVLAAEIK